MRAAVGDRIVMAGEQVDRPTRDGEVLEVRGSDGSPPYLVRWDDGHTALLYPGPGSVLRVLSPESPADPQEQAAEAAPPRPAHQWTVRVSVFDGDDTEAVALLVADEPVRATGVSHRRAVDPPEPRIGEELAVARALRHLADQLLERATSHIEDSTGEAPVHVSPT